MPGHEKPWCWAGGVITSEWSHEQPVILWICKGLPSQVVDIAYVAARPIRDWFPAKGNWATAEMKKLDSTRLKVAIYIYKRWSHWKFGSWRFWTFPNALPLFLLTNDCTKNVPECYSILSQSLMVHIFNIHIYIYCSLSVNSWVRRSIVQNFETNFGAYNIFRSIQKNVNRKFINPAWLTRVVAPK